MSPCSCLAQAIRGETSLWELRLEDRALALREDAARLAHDHKLIDVFASDTSQRDYDLQLPLLFSTSSRPGIRGTYSDFLSRFEGIIMRIRAGSASVP